MASLVFRYHDGRGENCVIETKSFATFKFGDGKKFEAKKCVTLPCRLAGKNIHIKADVVECDIPLLLSKASMKRAGMIMDMTADMVVVFGSAVLLSSTSMGTILPIFRAPTESAVNQVLLNCSLDSPKTMVLKLHRQFTHATTPEKLKKLLKNANPASKEYLEAVDKVTESCEICIKFKRARLRPVLSMPLASTFNETISMDLEIFQGVYFLVIVDLSTRYCSAIMLNNKAADTVI